MPERVLIIDFPEDVVRQSETGDVPPTIGGGSAGQPNLRRVFERFIEGLEGAPVRRPYTEAMVALSGDVGQW